jgi:TorA maturation chaperone TorD
MLLDKCVEGCAEESKILHARADVCRFLAASLRFPTPEFVEELRTNVHGDDIVALFRDAAVAVDSNGFSGLYSVLGNVHSVDISQQLSDFRSAYTLLFSHPERPLIPPYESQFLYWEQHPEGSFDKAPRMFVSTAALNAERIYKEAGVSLSDEFREPGDLISTELQFFALLLDEKGSSIEAEKTIEIERINALVREFSHYHISKWWKRFFDRLARSAVHPYYDAIGAMGSVFLDELYADSTAQIGA